MQELCLRHNLDVMHIEKNICESLVGTLLNINGKTKDGVNSRRDLQVLGIRHELHVKECGDKVYLPAAPHTLSKAEKQLFCNRLFKSKMPDGYCSNISNCISLSDCKILGLKSHDECPTCHESRWKVNEKTKHIYNGHNGSSHNSFNERN